MVTKLTLELPEDLAIHISSLPEAERNHYAIALLRAGMDVFDADTAGKDYDEAVAGIAAGFADMDSGKIVDADVFFDRFEATRRK